MPRSKGKHTSQKPHINLQHGNLSGGQDEKSVHPNMRVWVHICAASGASITALPNYEDSGLPQPAADAKGTPTGVSIQLVLPRSYGKYSYHSNISATCTFAYKGKAPQNQPWERLTTQPRETAEAWVQLVFRLLPDTIPLRDAFNFIRTLRAWCTSMEAALQQQANLLQSQSPSAGPTGASSNSDSSPSQPSPLSDAKILDDAPDSKNASQHPYLKLQQTSDGAIVKWYGIKQEHEYQHEQCLNFIMMQLVLQGKDIAPICTCGKNFSPETMGAIHYYTQYIQIVPESDPPLITITNSAIFLQVLLKWMKVRFPQQRKLCAIFFCVLERDLSELTLDTTCIIFDILAYLVHELIHYNGTPPPIAGDLPRAEEPDAPLSRVFIDSSCFRCNVFFRDPPQQASSEQHYDGQLPTTTPPAALAEGGFQLS